MAFTVGIYARYSSSLQNPRSTDDQVYECRRMAAQRFPGCEIELYVDPKLKGSFSGNRPQYQRLLKDIKARKLNAVVAEDMDRIARDQEDTAHINKACKFAGVEFVTIFDGKITEMHIGLKGAMNSIFLEALSLKTNRGCTGQVRAGKLRGAATYGYERTADGGRAVNKDEAAIVRRVLAEYAAGLSGSAIARRLNQEGIPGFKGGKWTQTAILGHPAYHTGLVNNELLVGRYVWNRLRYVVNPDTGGKEPRERPREEWVVVEHPHLRIVSDKLWDAVKARQAKLADIAGPTKAFHLTRRPKHPLTGLIKCSLCGKSYVSTGGRLYCRGYVSSGACKATSILRSVVEARVRKAMEERLMRPELQAAFEEMFSTYVAEENKRRAKVDTKALTRELAKVKASASQLVDLALNMGEFASFKEKLTALETRRREIEQALEAASQGEVDLPTLHPDMAKVFAKKVRTLWAAINGDDVEAAEAREALRTLIDKITVERSKDAEGGYKITLFGKLAGILALAAGADAATYTLSLAGGCQRLCVIAA